MNIISTAEILARAKKIAGLSLAALAEQMYWDLPSNTTQAKGWIGQLIETALGAMQASRAGPDFPELKIEIKTLPIDTQGRVLESTYVCRLNFQKIVEEQWRTSSVYQKLATVLWVPVLAERQLDWQHRIIGQAILMDLDSAAENILAKDWQEFRDLIVIGAWETIDARMGTYLQIRPKASNAKAQCLAHDSEGNRIQTLPRGFYLRAKFTQQLLLERWVCRV